MMSTVPVPQLHARGEGCIQNINKRARETKAKSAAAKEKPTKKKPPLPSQAADELEHPTGSCCILPAESIPATWTGPLDPQTGPSCMVMSACIVLRYPALWPVPLATLCYVDCCICSRCMSMCEFISVDGKY